MNGRVEEETDWDKGAGDRVEDIELGRGWDSRTT